MYSAIALDLDGTTLDSHSRISEELVKLLCVLRNNKVKVFLATGRTKLEVEEVLPAELEVDGLVTANGMVCYIKDEIIHKNTLSGELVHMAVQKAIKEQLYYEVHPQVLTRYALVKSKPFMQSELSLKKPVSLHDNEYFSRLEAVKSLLNWENELKIEDIIKVYFFSMDLKKIDKFKGILESMKEKYSFTISASSLHNTEIIANNTSKATGINILLKKYNLSPNNLLAIGDAENDLPMFEIAGRSVAMKNAEKYVKQKANEVTNYSYNENGLYLYLKEKFSHILNEEGSSSTQYTEI